MSSSANISHHDVETLASLIASQPESIEILPGDASAWVPPDSEHHPYLLVEGNLGVPQKELYKVYVQAVSVFARARRSDAVKALYSCTGAGSRSTSSSAITPPSQRDTTLAAFDAQDPSIRTLIAASTILALANPAHQTALSARRRLISSGLIDARSELWFTRAVLLCARHCAKEAGLWFHRRWVLARVHGCDFGEDGARSEKMGTMEMADVKRELEMAGRACEVYPRNYFAWMHRVVCVRLVLSSLRAGSEHAGGGRGVEFVQGEMRDVRAWIDVHVGDYSAVHHLVSVLRAILLDEGFDAGAVEVGKRELEMAVEHSGGLVRAYPGHEALWMYVRAVYALALEVDMSPGSLEDATVDLLASSGDHSEETAWNAGQFGKWKEVFVRKGGSGIMP
ncbi:protein prenylyltransferase [Coniophora puteana RWD-64-598 SS2]|uniref:Protein prenylyltransferase n=1 Tax=Coniophora puteana (strain RWD-64-598) TaxID=741705 RepID=A0A5M3MQA5_CONPW|nr:protein prenylyltransferase [Coniophora puteana RWD-64-598 SS2]EIW80721.1 protein prenylyltransferase [Coniophora puteana RWD-64-598 SS2]